MKYNLYMFPDCMVINEKRDGVIMDDRYHYPVQPKYIDTVDASADISETGWALAEAAVKAVRQSLHCNALFYGLFSDEEYFSTQKLMTDERFPYCLKVLACDQTARIVEFGVKKAE